MSDMKKQETGDALGEDRDFFEEDYSLVAGMRGMALEGLDMLREAKGMPGFEPPFTNLEPGAALEWPEEAAVQLKGFASGFDFYALVGRKELDDDQTKESIADLQKNGVVTIIDGKSGTKIDSVAYKLAAHALDGGSRYPYDDPEDASPAVDWAHAAIRGIVDELRDRSGICHYLEDIDLETRVEIVEALSDIVRAAFIRRAA